MDNQVYKKVGRRYVKIGYSDGWHGFPSDGVWLVNTTTGSKSSECILKIADNNMVLPYAGNLLAHKEDILKFLLDNKDFELNNKTYNEFVNDMLKYISNKRFEDNM
jgi:hypothetical protein